MAKTGPSGKRGRESGGLDHAPAHKAPVRAQKNHGNGIKRCKTSDVASEALCKIKISSILEEFGCLGSLGLEINPGPSLASAQRDPVHAVPKDEKKAYKRAPPAKQICCKCATVRAAPAGCKSGINFCCRDSVGKHACAIKCIWTGCKRNICVSSEVSPVSKNFSSKSTEANIFMVHLLPPLLFLLIYSLFFCSAL